jgi:hypothetical protein
VQDSINITCLCNYASKTNCGVVPAGCDVVCNPDLCDPDIYGGDWLELEKDKPLDYNSSTFVAQGFGLVRFHVDDKCTAWWIENFMKHWGSASVAIYHLEIGYPISYSVQVNPWYWYETYLIPKKK